MKYINTFKTYASYEEKLNGGGVDISLPNISYCEDVKDAHYNPYNTVEFYVGEITEPQTVKIYTNSNTSVPIQVSEGNKWYSYVIPKDKGLFQIEGNSVKKVVVKADISFEGWSGYPDYIIIPYLTVEASFKGSNTSNVTNMRKMFNGRRSLTSLDISSFDTSNVTDMSAMFYSCNSLTSLYISNFNTSKVTDMSGMFTYCSGLTSLDVSRFDTSNVTDMGDMFDGCRSITSLDLRNFNTSNVTDMSYMFLNCSSLTTLDLSKFDTSNVTNMRSMFSNCSNLTSLDLSRWNTSKVTNMRNIFNGCTSLRTIRMVGCTTETRTKIEEALTAAGIKDNVTIVTE